MTQGQIIYSAFLQLFYLNDSLSGPVIRHLAMEHNKIYPVCGKPQGVIDTLLILSCQLHTAHYDFAVFPGSPRIRKQFQIFRQLPFEAPQEILRIMIPP